MVFPRGFVNTFACGSSPLNAAVMIVFLLNILHAFFHPNLISHTRTESSFISFGETKFVHTEQRSKGHVKAENL